MTTLTPSTALQLQSLISNEGKLEISLAEVNVPTPAADEVLVRVEAAPINPSDLGLLFGAADMGAAAMSGGTERPIITAPVPEKAMKAMAGRLGQPMPVGNEGAGVVVRAGSSTDAQNLLGKNVAMLGGGMYAQYRCISMERCLQLPDDVTAEEGASCFVNPITALGMVETMRGEGHKAIVHAAAASNLGLMLNRICLKDSISLVNIVRKQDQVDLLKSQGAKYVCNTESPDFLFELTDAIAATGATVAFDPIGGGKLAGQILTCMEAALNRDPREYSRYGSTTHKQVYIYGMLDTSKTEITRNFGFSWGMGGWLLFNFLAKIGPDAEDKLRQRVANELKTTFVSNYSHEVSLAEALKLDTIKAYTKKSTGAKYLMNPNKGI
ncbi:zinc-binding dehydrogenase [Burkholderiales bacterium]|nr:zinc-binding dehydrogenase [Burkholderiales bacterium]